MQIEIKGALLGKTIHSFHENALEDPQICTIVRRSIKTTPSTVHTVY
jgi:hypothetical protein